MAEAGFDIPQNPDSCQSRLAATPSVRMQASGGFRDNLQTRVEFVTFGNELERKPLRHRIRLVMGQSPGVDSTAKQR